MAEKRLAFFEAIATLVGTVIGAGVLAIPYAMNKAGFLTGLLNLVVLGISVMFIYLYLGEIALRTPGNYQITGYAEHYLGKKGKMIIAFTMIFGIYGALIAYITGVGKSLAALTGLQSINIIGLALKSDLFYSIIFFAFAATIVYFGLAAIKKSELIMSFLVILVLIFACLFAFHGINFSELNFFNKDMIFVPYGVILFALAGAVAIPEMKEELAQNKKMLKKAIIIGTLIPIILYFVFSMTVIGVCGKNTSEIASICLGEKFGEIMIIFGNLFAILAMSTSFLTLGLALKEMYNYDYRVKKMKAWLLTCIIPFILFFLIAFLIKEEIFFKVIGLSGGISITIEGIVLVLMFHMAKKLGTREPEYKIKENALVSSLLVLVFLLGLVYTLLDAVGIL